MNNLVKYMLEDVYKYIKEHPEDKDRLKVKIYLKNDNQPLSFCFSCDFSMRDDEILVIEYGNYPERTVIPVEEISYYELEEIDEDESAEEDEDTYEDELPSDDTEFADETLDSGTTINSVQDSKQDSERKTTSSFGGLFSKHFDTSHYDKG